MATEYDKCCINCKNLNLFGENPCSANSPSFVEHDPYDMKEEMEVLSKVRDCKEFSCAYIEYPIEVTKINTPDPTKDKPEHFAIKCDENSGKPVRVRLAGEPEINTYLGIYLGDGAVNTSISYDIDGTKELTIGFWYNPVIFVPDLKKFVYGCESWWEFIKDEDDLKMITDEMTNNTWYVQAMKDNFNVLN